MIVFVDTSAMFALIDPDDAAHTLAAGWLTEQETPGTELVTHDYVVVEVTALAQSRLGMDAVRVLHRRLLAATTVRPVPPETRETAVAALLAADRRRVSLVDRVSFEFMRRWGLDVAFAFDDDFEREGFTCVP